MSLRLAIHYKNLVLGLETSLERVLLIIRFLTFLLVFLGFVLPVLVSTQLSEVKTCLNYVSFVAQVIVSWLNCPVSALDRIVLSLILFQNGMLVLIISYLLQ